MSSDDIKAWDRLPEETDRAYVAFCAYRDQGPLRTKIGTYREMYGRPDAKKLPAFFRDWSRLYVWDDRADVWDRYVAHRQQEALVTSLVHETEARAVLHIRQARKMQEIAFRALALKDPTEMTMRDIREWIETSQKLERLAAGEATEISQVTNDGDPTSVTQVMNTLIVKMQENPAVAREIEHATDAELAEVIETHLGLDVRGLLGDGEDGES